VLDFLTDLVTDSAATHFVVAGLVALDAVLPVAPSETVVVTGGVLAADGDLSLAVLVAAAAAGALAGHSILFLLGRSADPGVRRWVVRSERAGRRVDRAAAILRRRTWLLIVSDCLPVGHTAAMFAAGALELPAARFYSFVVPGAIVWASFYALLGYAGGSAFESEWSAFAVSIGAALLLSAIAEWCTGSVGAAAEIIPDGPKYR
jgi:membrane-associated protein